MLNAGAKPQAGLLHFQLQPKGKEKEESLQSLTFDTQNTEKHVCPPDQRGQATN